LQQHILYFDPQCKGYVSPYDTFMGFYALGFSIFLCILSVLIIHSNFSYPTVEGYLPDPFFRIYIARIHKCKHGSDTGTYDTEGRYIPQKFEDFWSKYGKMYGGQVGMTKRDLWHAVSGNRLYGDLIGTFGEMFEWTATYIMLWPKDGIVRKEAARRVFDGSLFHELARTRRMSKATTPYHRVP